MDRFSGNFADLSSDLRTTKAKVEGIVEELDGLLADNRENVNQGLQDLRYTAQAVARHIDAITYNLEGTSRNMHEFSRQIRQNPGLLLGGTPPRDEAR
jgi:phospholipid/cholesterol/gamma-HCH transport system substrate-binding protein